MPRPSGRHRVLLALASLVLFLVALCLSWTLGADRLTVQFLAIGLALVACLLAALAAGLRIPPRAT